MKDFLMSVLTIDSVSTDLESNRACMELFAKKARQHDLKVIWNDNPLYLIIGRGDLHHPDVGIVCHLDVVPPYIPPKIDGNRIYGRGTIDMKGPTVACFYGLIDSDHENVAIAFTGDEETSGDTGAFLSTQFVPKNVLIVPDQNRNFDLTKDAKGVLAFTLTATGKTAHGSTPWAGKNAVELLLNIQGDLRQILEVKNEPGWHNTLNLSYIRSDNQALNVVPEQAVAGFDLRFATFTAEYWKERISRLIEDHNLSFDVEMSAERIEVSLTDEVLLFTQCVQQIANRTPDLLQDESSCDARFWTGKVPSIIITKSAGGLAHAPDEYCEYDSLEKLRSIIRIYLERLTSSPESFQSDVA